MPTKLAKFTSTPAGTQWKTENGQWQGAKVGDPLYENYECRNTQQNNYGIEVESGVEVQFPDGLARVTADNYKGTAEYLNSSQEWVSLPVNRPVQCYSIRTDKDSILPVVIASQRGSVKPRGWGD